MGESPSSKDDRDVRRARLGVALRENLKRRKAQARGRDGKSSMMSSSSPSDSADHARADAEKKDD